MIGERHKAVTKTTGNEELPFVFLRELYTHPLFVGRTVMTEIYRHIQHGAAHTPYELRLRFITLLKMNPTQRAFHGAQRMIILYKIIIQACFLHGAPAPAFHEESTVISKDFWNQDDHTIQFCFYDIHGEFLSVICIRYCPYSFFISGSASRISCA